MLVRGLAFDEKGKVHRILTLAAGLFICSGRCGEDNDIESAAVFA